MYEFYEIWKFRLLLSSLVSRNLKTRYRGTILGFFWSFLNPLLLIGVYSLVFKYYIRFSTDVNYTLFLLTGLLPWSWFSSSLIEGSTSISTSGHLVTKALFPPQILPLVAVVTNLFNYIFALPLLILYSFYTGHTFSFAALLVIPLVIIQGVLCYGLSLLLASLNVIFRDVQHLLSNFLNLLFFLCPIVYESKTIPDKFKFTLSLNPIGRIIDSYHSLLLYGLIPSLLEWSFLISTATFSLLLGLYCFRITRDKFAEIL